MTDFGTNDAGAATRSPSGSLSQLLAERHSCRAFRSQQVPRAVIERILALAQRTASWTNAQPWQVHIVSDAATDRFRDVMLAAAQEAPAESDFPWPSAYEGVYQERRRECGFSLYASVGIAKGDRVASARQAQENFRFFGAPHVAIITTDAALGVYGAVDCGAYVSNFLLAATAEGVATIAQAALASRSRAIRKYLQLPASRRVVCGISFGYRDDDHPANRFRTTRAPLSEVVNWVT